MLPYPATRFAKKLSNLCGAKQQLAGVKFSSAGADANKGFLVMGLFTGHMLPSFQNLTAPIMLIARARTDKRNAASSLLMRFTPFLQIHEDSVQIKEGLNQVIELDENLVNTAQVICDKLDALRTQGQDVRNLCDLTSNTKQPDSLQKAPNAQK